MFYRFVFGTDSKKDGLMLGFTIEADDRPAALKKAQIVADGMKVTGHGLDSQTFFDGFHNQAKGEDVVLYIDEKFKVTEDHIEDECEDDENA